MKTSRPSVVCVLRKKHLVTNKILETVVESVSLLGIPLERRDGSCIILRIMSYLSLKMLCLMKQHILIPSMRLPSDCSTRVC